MGAPILLALRSPVPSSIGMNAPGVIWTTPSEVPLPSAWNAFAFAHGTRVFVASDRGSTPRSADGTTWATYAIANGFNPIPSQPYGGKVAGNSSGRFLCPVPNVNTWLTTLDTDTKWSTINVPSAVVSYTDSWTSCVHASGMFLVTSNSFKAAVVRMTDAATGWALGNLPVAGYWTVLASDDTNALAVANASTDAATSANGGNTWTHRVLPVSGNWSAAVALVGGTMVIVASGSATALSSSNTGVSWTQRTLPSASAWSALAACGTAIMALAGGASPVAALSTDGGASWASVTLPAGHAWSVLGADATNFYLAASGDSVFAKSADNGATWSIATLPVNGAWLPPAWDGTKYVSVASDTSWGVVSGDNGATWTSVALPVSGSWDMLAAGTDLVVAASSTDDISLVSSDHGSTWTEHSSVGPLSAPATKPALVFGNGVFVSIINPGGTGSAQTTADGVTWTTHSLPTNGNSYVTLVFDGNRFVTITNNINGATLGATSTDGATWTAWAPPANDAGVTALAYGNGMLEASELDGYDSFPDATGAWRGQLTLTIAEDLSWLVFGGRRFIGANSLGTTLVSGYQLGELATISPPTGMAGIPTYVDRFVMLYDHRATTSSATGGWAPAISMAHSLPTPTHGVAYSGSVTGTLVNGATGTIDGYSATGLPSGLSINATTGAVTGTPSTAGAFSATITAVSTWVTASQAWRYSGEYVWSGSVL